MNYDLIWQLAIILLSTKVLGLISRHLNMPQVVGALIAGLILGPTFLNIVRETDFIKITAEIGVIMLMFTAGLETEIKQFKKSGKASFIIAVFGVVLPLVLGFLVASIYNNHGHIFNQDYLSLLENIFIGVILTATSVSITVETLKEMGKLNTKSGNAVLGAAIIDDILGIIILTIIIGLKNPDINVWFVLLKIAGFFIISAVVGFPFMKLLNKYSLKVGEKRRFTIISISFALFMSYAAEHFFGVADITGAFVAGLIIANTVHSNYVTKQVDILSYTYLSPVFFASIGISTRFTNFNWEILAFALILLIVAIFTKIFGCWFGARISGFTNKEALQTGVGMVSRGEVALIVANKGNSYGLMNPIFFAPIILMVIVTSIITPILLKFSYSGKKKR